MSTVPTKLVQLTSNDEAVLGVFDRLKADISEIKSANSSRNSVDRTLDSMEPPVIAVRGSHSRQNSVTTDVPSSRHRTTKPSSGDHMRTDGEVSQQDSARLSTRQNGSSRMSESGKHQSHGNRSRVESYSSRTDKTSRTSNRSEVNGDTSKRSSNRHKATPSERSLYMGQDVNRTLNREHSFISNGRNSTTSERSHRSSRPKGFDWSTEQFLSQYHREWMLHYQYQQQQQLAAQQIANQSAPGTPVYRSVPVVPTPTVPLPSVSSSSNLSSMNSQPFLPKNPVVARPVAPAQIAAVEPPPVKPAAPVVALPPPVRPPVSVPVLKPHSGQYQKSVAKPQRSEWRGCILSADQSSEILRSGRTTTVTVKTTPCHADSKNEIEMAMFPGMLLWDSPELRDRVVDFGRHMSSLASETADIGTVEIESVFWDLAVHLVSRAENSRPYEISEILARLVKDTGRNSVASIRSVAGGRDRYSEHVVQDIRKRLLVGDVESAAKYAEDGNCWDLALCLQAVSSNIECRNQQANDLAVKSLDQRLLRGDPVHTICTLACGRLPSVEACFRDWVSNLAVVIACAGFIQQEELKLRFIANLSELLHSADMAVARDICLIFCSPIQRFEVDLTFLPIGAASDLTGRRNVFLENFSLESFYMTEVFVFLAQILQGINLHSKMDLIKMELRYVQMLLDRGLRRQAAEYCRNITMVVKEYGVKLSVELYSQLLELTTLCVASGQIEFQEEWCQWLWNIFVKKTNRRSSDASRLRRSVSRESVGFVPSLPSRSFHSEDSTMSRQTRDLDWDRGVNGDFYQPITPSASDISTVRETTYSEYSGSSRRGSVSEDFSPYAPSVRRPSETPSTVSTVKSAGTSHAVSGLSSSSSHSQSHPPLSAKNSLTDTVDSVPDLKSVSQAVEPSPPPPPVQMYQPATAPSRPSLFMSFPHPGQAVTNSLHPFPGSSNNYLTPTTAEPYSASTPTDSSLNTGNAPYFAPDRADDDEPKPSTSKLYDPTALNDEPPPAKGKATAAEQKEAAVRKAENIRNHPGLFGNVVAKIGKFFKRNGQVHLPADTKPVMVYDKVKKRWINTAKPEGEEEETVAPPPRMTFPAPMSSSAAAGPGGPPSSRPPPPGGNAFRLSAAPASGGYNPYAHLLTPTAAPQRTFDASSHFIPAPTIPEE